jgi:hypothetical protein
MACPGGCTNGGGQVRVEDAREVAEGENAAPSSEPQKPTPNEQRAWLARVDEAYYSAESEDEDTNISSSTGQSPMSVQSLLSHWSSVTNIPLSKLVYTTFRKVESDVGKNKDSGGVGDMARVAELAGKIGGGW